jgi:DNA-binding transcriptional ArsR family regulator
MDTMNENIQNDVMNFFRALSNADRLKIAGALGLEALSLEQVTEKLGMRSTDAYNHLSSLVHFGLVKTDGKLYSLDKQALEALSKRVLANSRPKPSLDDFEGEAFDKKVLSDFLTPEGRLKAFPTQHKKLLVVLRQAQTRFTEGEKYTEKQVNDILRGFFDDTASLRRYLVDNKMLERDKGIYWRV